MDKQVKLPNFLIVGAAKSGTTSLYHYLKQHKDIFMPEYKEPQYFVSEKVQGRIYKSISSFKEYEDLFEGVHQKAVGEASVFYLCFHEEAIPKIKSVLGNKVKIIIVLRNPVDRAFSAYRHVSRNSLKETLSFEEALVAEEGRLEREPNMTPMAMYKSMSMYSNSVQAYMSSFKDVHVVLDEDLKHDATNALKTIFNFLEVDQEVKIDFKKHYNVGSLDWSNSFLKKVVFGKGVWKTFVKKVIPSMVLKTFSKKLRLMGGKKVEKISEKTKLELQSYFREDVMALSKTIGRNLKHWIDVA